MLWSASSCSCRSARIISEESLISNNIIADSNPVSINSIVDILGRVCMSLSMALRAVFHSPKIVPVMRPTSIPPSLDDGKALDDGSGAS